MIFRLCALLSFIFVALAIFSTSSILVFLTHLEKSSLKYFGQFYSVLGLLAFLVLPILAIFPVGKIKLGTEKPKISRISWIAMLYSTGMGSGLLLRAVQEPLHYYSHPPVQSSQDLTILSLKYTFYHWGFTPWAFYCLFGLILAYFHFNDKRELITSSAITDHPLEKIDSQIYNCISAIATLIGVVAALCLGGSQWVKGLSILTGIEFTSFEVLSLILFIVLCSTLSAISGVYKSIRIISLANILIAFFLMLFVFLNGQPLETIILFFKSYAVYIYDFIPMSLNWDQHKTSTPFLMEWTYFYWAFWLAWTPFTALFIARISAGRSIREFIFCTLFIPSLGTFVWFSVFGNSVFNLVKNGQMKAEHFSSIYDSLFLFLETLPFSPIIKVLALINVFSFLLTSLDSAILVLSSHIQSKSISSKKQKTLWGVLLALSSVAILSLGQTGLLKIVSLLLVLMALPLSLLYSAAIFTFLKRIIVSKAWLQRRRRN